MADNEKNPVSGEDFSKASGESAEDILAEILSADGTFNSEFNGLFERYLGVNSVGSAPVAPPVFTSSVQSSSKTEADYSQQAGQRVEYEAPEYVSPQHKSKHTDFEDKLPADVREVYSSTASQAQKPEFTAQGTVRYPVMGVGEAEERVVYDADWEEKAKKEAARLERVRQDNMLRGDSAWARSFVSGGVPMASRAPSAVKRPAVNPAYIDPLSDDGSGDISFAQHKAEETEKKEKKSFFQEGFSATQVKNDVADGKTEANNSGNKTQESKNTYSKDVNDKLVDALTASLGGQVSYSERFSQTTENGYDMENENTTNAQKEESDKLISKHPGRKSDEIRVERKHQPSYDVDGVKVSQNEIDALARLADSGFADFSSEFAPDTDVFDDFTADKASVQESFTEKDAVYTRSAEKKDRKIKKSFSQKMSFFIKNRFSKEGFGNFVYGDFPNKNDSAGEKIRKIIRAVAFIALVCGIIYLVIYGCNYLEKIKQNDKFQTIVDEYETLEPEQLEDAWENIKVNYPDVEFPEGMNIKFASLYAINQDVVGWLTIPETNISTVLLQGKIDEFYMYKDIYKQYSRYGSPFVDIKAKMGRDAFSKNTIIYGHNTHDGLMFHQLTNYMTVEGYKKAPVVTLETFYETTKWKIFAVMLTNSTPEADNGFVFRYLYTDFNSESAFMAKIDEIYARSMIHTGVDVQRGDKILTLYTCYQNLFSGGRLAVFARQVREGESEEVDLSKVYYDTTARFPQAYYDKKGLTNPYYSSSSSSSLSEETTLSQIIEDIETTLADNETTLADTETTLADVGTTVAEDEKTTKEDESTQVAAGEAQSSSAEEETSAKETETLKADTQITSAQETQEDIQVVG